jgi:hypothetical protein
MVAGKLVEKPKLKPPTFHVMNDIKDYRVVGPEYGKVITSRSRHREYLKRHNLIEVGNVAEPEAKETKEVEPTKTVEVSPEVEAEIDASVSEDVSAEAEPAKEVKADEVSPPKHWSDEDKEAFKAMDEGGREWALRLETNASKGIEKKSAELKTLRDAFEPYKHLFPAGSEAQAIQQLFNAQVSLQTNPVEGIKWLMRSYGVDEKQFAPSTEATDEFQDPDVAALRAEIKELKTNSERNAQTAQVTQQNAMIAEINQFRDAEDNGELLHPHYQEVVGVMSGLMQSGRADSLENAYEQAVWSLPEYRDSEVKKLSAEKAEADLKERTKEAEKAEKAAKTVTGANGATLETKPETLRDSLEAAYEQSVRGE